MPQSAADPSRAVKGRIARARIVSVEDEEDFRCLLREWLSPDYDFISLPHGEELLQEVDCLQPDLVMLDIGLPGPDGLRLCERLRRRPNLNKVPILILTGRQDDEAYIDSFAAGATSFLPKPVTRGDLMGRIRKLL